MQLTVARIGRAHGLRGEVAARPAHRRPRRAGSPSATRAARPTRRGRGPLTVARTRAHQDGAGTSTFAEVDDRTGAEALRGRRAGRRGGRRRRRGRTPGTPTSSSACGAEPSTGGCSARSSGSSTCRRTTCSCVREPDGAPHARPVRPRRSCPSSTSPAAASSLDPPGGLLAPTPRAWSSRRDRRRRDDGLTCASTSSRSSPSTWPRSTCR